ncbi:MAG TPA: sigma-70 family RNA polymerase sigma factor [bacterium]|nr:sigma-70 family RNA polymerase sigma factor [bacterium]
MEETGFIQAFVSDPSGHWMEFTQRYGGVIKGQVFHLGFRGQDAEDALQEVFYELFKRDLARIRQWNPQRGAFMTFLRVVVSRILVDLHRSPKFRRDAQLDENSPELSCPSEGNKEADARECAAEEEIFGLIQQHLRQLVQSGSADAVDMLIFHCRYFELPGAVTARLTGLSENAVNLRFHRLKQEIQKFLHLKGLQII